MKTITDLIIEEHKKVPVDQREYAKSVRKNLAEKKINFDNDVFEFVSSTVVSTDVKV